MVILTKNDYKFVKKQRIDISFHSMIASLVGMFQFTDVVIQPIIMVATYDVVLTTIEMAK